MDHVEIADKAGVLLGDLESLLKGEATAKVANRFALTMADVEDFARGKGFSRDDEAAGFENDLGS